MKKKIKDITIGEFFNTCLEQHRKDKDCKTCPFDEMCNDDELIDAEGKWLEKEINFSKNRFPRDAKGRFVKRS